MMKVMRSRNFKRQCKAKGKDLRTAQTQLVCNKKKRRGCPSMEIIWRCNRRKKLKKESVNSSDSSDNGSSNSNNSSGESKPNNKLVIEKFWNSKAHMSPDVSEKRIQRVARGNQNLKIKCWVDVIPQEIMLKIFSYLPLGMLLHTVPQVCKKWEALALDWTLWKRVEDLTIKNMVISTAKLRTLLRTIPKLKKLELIQRNDAEELLRELIETHQNLEVLKLDRCYRSNLQMNMLSQTVTSLLEYCPKLKTVMLTDTHFHSKSFYRCLAKKFKTIERINVTCTTKSEMDVFVQNLTETVPEVEFQKVPMMGRAEGKHIYWGPILGLVIRPIPMSPFQQFVHESYPNYAF